MKLVQAPNWHHMIQIVMVGLHSAILVLAISIKQLLRILPLLTMQVSSDVRRILKLPVERLI